jgi:hypothetical protein
VREVHLIRIRAVSTVLLFGMAFFAAAATPSATQQGAGPAAATPAAVDDQGTFVLSRAGKQYGTEKFSIESHEGKIQAEGETQLREEGGSHSPLITTFSKLVLDSELHPLLYTWSTKVPKRYNLFVDFTAPLAKCQLHQPDGKDDIREFQLAKDVVVLDNNVIHHYQLLVDRYERTSGGKQAFKAFIPQAAMPGELTVQDAGMQTLTLAGTDQPLRHLVVLADNAEIDLWVDAQGRLQRLYWSGPQLEVLREH